MVVQSTLRFDSIDAHNYPEVQRIYEEGLSTGLASFELVAPEWDDWDANHLPHSRIVASYGRKIAGWAALSPVSTRCVYGGVAEVSVYVAQKYWGRGVGLALLGRLISESEQNGIWTLQAGIFPENTASIRLHQKAHFRLVGRRERIGRLNGVWKDTLTFERRSDRVGLI